jgi:hypothetical protein
VADLINQDNASWNTNNVRQLYGKETSEKILGIRIPKMARQTIQEKIIWPLPKSKKLMKFSTKLIKIIITLQEFHQRFGRNYGD